MQRMAKKLFLRCAQFIEAVVGVGSGVIFVLALARIPGLLGDSFVTVEIGLMMSSGTIIAICTYLFWKTTRALKSVDRQ